MNSFFQSLIAASLMFSTLQGFSQISTTPSYHKFLEPFSSVEETIAAFSHDNEDVLKEVSILLTRLERIYQRGEGLIEKDILLIAEAMKFVAEKHQHQIRRNTKKTPYIVHPLGVINTLLEIGEVRDPDILIGGLLHDTLEDTETTYEEIELMFGKRVADFVKEVTDDKSLTHNERKKLQIIHAPMKSSGAAQIKLADRFCNLKDIMDCPPAHWSKEETDLYFSMSKELIDALPWVNSGLKKAAELVIEDYEVLKTHFSPADSKYSTEHFHVNFPIEESNLWNCSVQKIQRNGRIFEMWFKDNSDERVVVVASPFKSEHERSLAAAINTIILPLKMLSNVKWEIHEKSDHEAIISWGIEGESVSISRVLITPFAFHSVSYTYKGSDTKNINLRHWQQFIMHNVVFVQ